MFIIVTPIIVAAVGLVMYIADNPKAAELGRIMFAVGLLCALLFGVPAAHGSIHL